MGKEGEARILSSREEGLCEEVMIFILSSDSGRRLSSTPSSRLGMMMRIPEALKASSSGELGTHEAPHFGGTPDLLAFL